jgi:hypothetical protein
MITENNVIESIKDSVNLADVSPEDIESTVHFIHRQYEIVLKAKDKEIEECRQEILHLRKMVESLAKEPIVINPENQNSEERRLARLSREILKTSFNEGDEGRRLARLSREILKTSFSEGDKEPTKYSPAQKILDLLKTDADKPKLGHNVHRALKSLGVGNVLASLGINTESSELLSSPIERVDSKQKVSSPPKTPRSRTTKTTKRK